MPSRCSTPAAFQEKVVTAAARKRTGEAGGSWKRAGSLQVRLDGADKKEAVLGTEVHWRAAGGEHLRQKSSVTT
jgi:hypothetical protein